MRAAALFTVFFVVLVAVMSMPTDNQEAPLVGEAPSSHNIAERSIEHGLAGHKHDKAGCNGFPGFNGTFPAVNVTVG